MNPRDPSTLPLRPEDARLAAQRGTVVVTTMSVSMRAPASLLPLYPRVQSASLHTLTESRVTLAVGSDNVSDSSVLEAEHVHSLGVVDPLALLKLGTEDTPRAIFPQRRIGFLRDGYEASFLALEGNPLEDWRKFAGSSCGSSRDWRCIDRVDHAAVRRGLPISGARLRRELVRLQETIERVLRWIVARVDRAQHVLDWRCVLWPRTP